MALTKANDRMLSFALNSAGEIQNAEKLENEVLVSSAINIVGNTSYCNVPHTVFKQENSANLSELITINLSNSVYTRMADINLYVDGNKDNNTAVTGIKATQIKRNSNRVSLSASDCDVGVNITDQVETAKIDVYADNCGTGLLINADDTVTPDELIVDLCAHDCDTFFETSGSHKSTGIITFACEQSNTTAVKINQGYWEIHGVIRGCSTSSLGSGLLIERDASSVFPETPNVSGNIRIFGGDNTNCEWAADIQSGSLDALNIYTKGDYANGVRIAGGVLGSARIKVDQLADSGDELELGDASNYLTAFTLLPPSYAYRTNLVKCKTCVLNFSYVAFLTISADSFDNTIYIPREYAGSLSITNNRTQQDNKIIFRGAYTIVELNALNGGTGGSGCFKGMEAEQCNTFAGARAYFDGNQWVPSHGALASGQLTIPSGTKTGTVAHGLSYDPGNSTLSFYSDSDPAGSGQFKGNVTSTNVTVVSENNVSADVVINWVLRKVS